MKPPILHRWLLGMLFMLSFACTRKTSILSSDEISHDKMHALHSISVIDNYRTPDGFYLFFNKKENRVGPQKLVLFMHGFGAINPAIYGKWIKYIIGQQCVVIYLRYQKSLFNPLPGKFAENISMGIRRGLKELKNHRDVNIEENEVYYIGHSYGGAAALYFGVEHELYDLPKPKAIFACQPGTGLFTALVLDDYGRMPEDIKVVVLSSENDDVVGHKMAELAFESLSIDNKAWIEHFGEETSHTQYKADHRSPYSIDSELDNSFDNVTYKRAVRTSAFDEEDTEGFFMITKEVLSSPDERMWLFNTEVDSLPINVWSNSMEFTAFSIRY